LGKNTIPLFGPVYMWWIRTIGGALPGYQGALSSLYAATSVEAGTICAGDWGHYESKANIDK
ncbi:hypothetical protein HDU93_003056, partial [Gonapodya sp. JEL0774]